jgi:hypothetical protein
MTPRADETYQKKILNNGIQTVAVAYSVVRDSISSAKRISFRSLGFFVDNNSPPPRFFMYSTPRTGMYM